MLKNNAQNPLDTSLRNFPVKVANLLPTSRVIKFGKRYDTTNTTDFLPAQTCYRLVAYLFMLRTCYGLATRKLMCWILA